MKAQGAQVLVEGVFVIRGKAEAIGATGLIIKSAVMKVVACFFGFILGWCVAVTRGA